MTEPVNRRWQSDLLGGIGGVIPGLGPDTLRAPTLFAEDPPSVESFWRWLSANRYASPVAQLLPVLRGQMAEQIIAEEILVQVVPWERQSLPALLTPLQRVLAHVAEDGAVHAFVGVDGSTRIVQRASRYLYWMGYIAAANAEHGIRAASVRWLVCIEPGGWGVLEAHDGHGVAQVTLSLEDDGVVLDAGAMQALSRQVLQWARGVVK